MMEVALKGELKFRGRRMPNIRANPIAISEYPEKSKEGSTYNTVVRKAQDGSMEVERVPVVPQTDAMKQIIEANE